MDHIKTLTNGQHENIYISLCHQLAKQYLCTVEEKDKMFLRKIYINDVFEENNINDGFEEKIIYDVFEEKIIYDVFQEKNKYQ